jgi:DNA-directed RNA polymerase subunit omega
MSGRRDKGIKRLDKDFQIRYNSRMIFPLKDLIEYDENMYEVTIAASRRAYQLSTLMDKDEKEDYDGKMVALAARQVFTKEVQFRLEAE